MEPLVWFITGGSSGFGSAIGEHVLGSGDKATVTARDKQSTGG
jgi:NADP-dependent 3-hydroxy acid dehydrogenase YdfG